MAEAVKRLKNISQRRSRSRGWFDESLHEFGLRVSEIVARTQALQLQEEKNKLEREIKEKQEQLELQQKKLREQEELLSKALQQTERALKGETALYLKFRCSLQEDIVFKLLQNISSIQTLEKLLTELKQQAILSTQTKPWSLLKSILVKMIGCGLGGNF